MPNFNDVRGVVADEVLKLHQWLDTFHQRFHTAADEFVQEAISQVAAGNNPFFGQAQHNAPGGFVPEAPTSEGSSSTQSSSGSSAASSSSSSSSSSSDGKSSDAGSSGSSQPK